MSNAVPISPQTANHVKTKEHTTLLARFLVHSATRAEPIVESFCESYKIIGTNGLKPGSLTIHKFLTLMREIKRDIVSALIFAKDGKLFQGMKDSERGGVYSDCWHLPGGGAEEGENREKALEREIKEETGIDISGYKIALIDDAGRGESNKILATGEEVICKMKFFVYKIEINDKNANKIKVSLDDDLVKYRWTDPEELINLKLTPPSTELFKKIGYL